MTRSTRSAGRRHRNEEGAGIVSTVAGVAVFLVLLLLAVQVLVGLYATSVVTAVTYDAAKVLAGADQGDSAAGRAHAEAAARRQLGRFGERAAFRWDNDADTVRLDVKAPRPTLLPRALVSG
ncbi:MAG: hypothetical protein M3N31_08095, partial [Actinomycetota bacterium]|nr:hypothetical protein [Actinomycetota bacterium]